MSSLGKWLRLRGIAAPVHQAVFLTFLLPSLLSAAEGKGPCQVGWIGDPSFDFATSNPFIRNPVADGSKKKVTVGHKPARLMVKSMFLFVIRSRSGNSPE